MKNTWNRLKPIIRDNNIEIHTLFYPKNSYNVQICNKHLINDFKMLEK